MYVACHALSADRQLSSLDHSVDEQTCPDSQAFDSIAYLSTGFVLTTQGPDEEPT